MIEVRAASAVPLVSRLRALAVRALARMYSPARGLFVFRLRRTETGIVSEGVSHRYSAIALIGLAEEDEATAAYVLAGGTRPQLGERLMERVGQLDNLGDLALTLWAARAVGHPERGAAWKRLLALRPAEETYPVVEVAWTLAALSVDPEARVGELRERLARRLISAFDRRSRMFPHVLGGHGGGFRGHVCCFADLVYPIHALARYAELFGDTEARDVALRCACAICARQGPAGQWWWHYDRRSGEVVERYPVYAVHQDAMAPMALFALQSATGIDVRSPIVTGLAWLARAPELGGASLVDPAADMIWRKVARREPAKLARYVQAAASRCHPRLRVPHLDVAFPAAAVDYEDRPYHLGWLLHAWPEARAAAWADPALPG